MLYNRYICHISNIHVEGHEHQDSNLLNNEWRSINNFGFLILCQLRSSHGLLGGIFDLFTAVNAFYGSKVSFYDYTNHLLLRLQLHYLVILPCKELWYSKSTSKGTYWKFQLLHWRLNHVLRLQNNHKYWYFTSSFITLLPRIQCLEQSLITPCKTQQYKFPAVHLFNYLKINESGYVLFFHWINLDISICFSTVYGLGIYIIKSCQPRKETIQNQSIIIEFVGNENVITAWDELTINIKQKDEKQMEQNIG